jgi:long-chain fatty acid transport protein
MDGNLDVNVLGLAPVPLHSDFDAQLDFVWPRSLGLGVKHDLSTVGRLSADVIWYDWSHAFEKVDLELTNASNPLFPALLGPKIRDTFPLDWRDSVSWRFGYERFLTECDVVRAGYVFHPNPIPSSTLTPLIPAILEHAFSVGYGKRWGTWRFDLAYQYSFGPKESTSVSRVVGGDFDFSEIRSQAHWVLASFAYEY